MHTNRLLNITRLKAVAQALKPLEQKVVFVGGATIALYTDPESASEVRPTDDVDVVVELASYGNYAVLEERLRQIGFINDKESNVICRYKIKGIIVDIMPTDPKVIGFSNRWYPGGFEKAILHPITENESIYIFPLEYLVASKLEAFLTRGRSNFIFSRDFEDLVYLLENGAEIENKLLSTKGELRSYLNTALKNLLQQEDFEEGLYAHLLPVHASFQVSRIRNLLESMVR